MKILSLAFLAALLIAPIGCQPVDTPDTSEGRGQEMAEGTLTDEELELRLALRDIWSDHVWYTRDYVNSAVADQPDKEAVATRLLENQDEMGDAIKPYFGDEAGDKLKALLRDHIVIATEVVAAAKMNNDEALTAANTKWVDNANQIADLLSSANPEYWPQDDMRAMMQKHLELLTTEVVSRIKGDWNANIDGFEEAHAQAMEMADMLSDGLVKKFPDKF
jgi:hypothetical protein